MSDAEKHLATRSVCIVLLDLGLADPKGLEVVRRVRAAAPRTAMAFLFVPYREKLHVHTDSKCVEP